MRKLPILDMRKVYVDSLAEWIYVPVFDQEQVIKLVNEIDWEGLEMWEYKQNLVTHWHNLPPAVKKRVKEPAVRDELYDALVNENWALAPGKVLEQTAFYTRTESENIETWFASRGVKGRPPEVISNGVPNQGVAGTVVARNGRSVTSEIE